MDYLAQVSTTLGNIHFFPIAMGVFFVFYWTSVFFVVYHLTRFGIGPIPKLFGLVFLLGSMAFFSLAMLAYSHVDFSQIVDTLKAQTPSNDTLHNYFKLPNFANPSVRPIPSINPLQ